MRLPAYGPALTAAALAYAVLHHIGSLPQGLGPAPSRTRWVDWLDLAVPYLVLTPVVLTLLAAAASRRVWSVAALGAVAYTSGHGIHLAANSISNVAPSSTVHLWDELVGHAVWYAGAAALAGALARTMPGRPRPGMLGYVLALAVGGTWVTNALGAGLELPALALAAAATAYGWRHRDGLAVVLLVGFAPAVLALLLSGAVAVSRP